MRQSVKVAPAGPLLRLAAALAVVAAAAAILPAAARAQPDQTVPADIYTIAGLGTDTGLNGPAAQAAIGSPDGVLTDRGNLYIADGEGNRVLEVAGSDQLQWGIQMTKGDLYVIAGSPDGTAGTSGNGTSRATSKLDDPVGLGMDRSGDLFIADFGNNRVMELTASASPWGKIADPVADALYRVAGLSGGRRGDGQDGGPATSSRLNGPAGVFIGGNAGGSLYIADSGNNRIQVVPQASGTRWGQRMTAYDVYTVAGSRAGAGASAGDGRPARSARLEQPQDVTIDKSGDLLIADTGNCRIQEVARASGRQWGSIRMTAGRMYTVAGRNGASCTGGGNKKPATKSDLNEPAGIADPAGTLFIADTDSNVIKVVPGRTGRRYGRRMTAGRIYAVSAGLNSPAAVSATPSGSLYIADTGNHQIREASGASPFGVSVAAGNGFTLLTAGDGGPALDSALLNPDGVVSDAQGNLYIADAGNNRVQEIAASDHLQFGIQMTSGDVYTIAGSATGEIGATRNGVPATAALLTVPTSIAVDGAGDVYICDSVNDRVVEVAATAHTQSGTHMQAGDTYRVAGQTGAGGDSGDGGRATRALLNLPTDVVVDRAGDLFIADTLNSRVQEVAATSGTQYGIVMRAGRVYTIAGSATGSYGTDGDGGPGFSALLSNPFGIAVDGAGDVYIADSGNNRIQELAATPGTQWGQPMQAGDIYTIAGSSSGDVGNSGDGGQAANALLYEPTDIALDSSGNLYIADTYNNQVRELAAESGSQRDQSMTAGDIYTVAGVAEGIPGIAVPGQPATSTPLDLPIDVGVDQAYDVIIPAINTSSLLEVAATPSSPFPVYPSAGTASAQLGPLRRALHGRPARGGCLHPRKLPSRRLTTAAARIYTQLGLAHQLVASESGLDRREICSLR